MKTPTFTTILSSALLTNAQLAYDIATNSLKCATPSGTYCAGASMTQSYIAHCKNSLATITSCKSALTTLPPLGPKPNALCFHTSPTTGDAACALNGTIYPPQGPTALPAPEKPTLPGPAVISISDTSGQDCHACGNGTQPLGPAQPIGPVTPPSTTTPIAPVVPSTMPIIPPRIPVLPLAVPVTPPRIPVSPQMMPIPLTTQPVNGSDSGNATGTGSGSGNSNATFNSTGTDTDTDTSTNTPTSLTPPPPSKSTLTYPIPDPPVTSTPSSTFVSPAPAISGAEKRSLPALTSALAIAMGMVVVAAGGVVC